MEKVISKDGTPIAVDRYGSGPALILVDGAMCSRGFGPMPPLQTHMVKQDVLLPELLNFFALASEPEAAKELAFQR